MKHWHFGAALAGWWIIMAIIGNRSEKLFWGPVSIIALAWIVYALIKYANRPQPAQAQLSEHGTARWQSAEEYALINGHNDEGPGLWIGGGVFRKKSGHIATFAQPGSGKGTCLIIPTLLVKPTGSYIVTDPKGENACITARAQTEYGQKVYILDPWGEQESIGAIHRIPSSGFNPFDMLKDNMEDLPDNCEMIAHYLIPENPVSNNKFWDARARSIIKNTLIYIITCLPPEKHTFWTLYKLVRTDDEEMIQMPTAMKMSDSYDGLLQVFANELIATMSAKDTYGGIMSHVHMGTALFESPKLRKSLERSDFNPYDLSNGNVTVYVVMPEKYITSHSAWLKIVMGLSLKAVNSRPNARVNFILDESAIIGKLEDVTRTYAYGRGQNIVMWTFWQSLSQLKELYGESGMSHLINNSKVIHAFGLTDQFSKEYVSKMLGDETRIQTSVSEGKERSTSYSKYGRALLTPEEVGKEPDIIVFTENGKHRAFRLPYFANRYKFVADYHRRVLKTIPKDEWHELFMQKADPAPRIH